MAQSKTELTKAMIEDRLRFEIAPGEVAYKRIAHELRDLIISKALLPGTRLPTLPQLSVLWNTNYYTVQTAITLLANEGLLTCKQRKGTFIAQNTPQIKSVGVYFGGNLWHLKHAAFYHALCAAFSMYFEKMNIDVHFFMDTRTRKQRLTPWKPLVVAIERKEINAVFAAMIIGGQEEWLNQLPVPISMFGSSKHSRVVDLGFHDFLQTSLVRLKERKCRSVALITAGQLNGADAFIERAKELGMKSRPEWVFKCEAGSDGYADFGYDSFSSMWSGPDKPDGLIVYPDSISLGVIMAILQNGIQVPRDLKVVFHCNDEVYIHCPFPADWMVVSIIKAVDGIWKSLRAQADGKAPRRVSIAMSIQPPTSDIPPVMRKWKSPKELFGQEEEAPKEKARSRKKSEKL